MNTSLNRLPRLALAALPLCTLLITSPLRAEDSDSDQPKRPGFFQRLGNSIFHGTRKLERSDTIDPTTGGHGSEDGTLPPGSTTKKSKNSTSSTTAPTPRRQAATAPVSNADSVNPSSATAEPSVSGDPDAAKRLKPKHSPAPKDEEPAPTPKTTSSKKGADKGESAAKDKDTSTAAAKDKDKDPASENKDDYPLGTKGHTSGFVKSPFPPYNELDARGMVSGTLAKDPTTGKIFRVP